MRVFFAKSLILAILMFFLTGWVFPPKNPEHICQVFGQNPSWYRAAKRSEQRWGTPVHVQMAIIYQESRFKARVKPRRKQLLGLFPWMRPTSAYGYGQITDGTWTMYKRNTGKKFVSRTRFRDTVDFVAWYGHYAKKNAGINPSDAYKLYLAYHEGVGGYKRQSFKHKPSLLGVAEKVRNKALIYRQQMQRCGYH